MVFDTTYYDLLSLQPTATALDIKKAYRKAAIKLHPDKNPDDSEAHARFQEVGQAYQVLSDEKLRQKYDKCGIQESIPSEGFEDPAEFFSKIFGGEAFKDWIGELSLLSEISKCADLSGEYEDEKPTEIPSKKDTNKIMENRTTETDDAGTFYGKQAVNSAGSESSNSFGKDTMFLSVGESESDTANGDIKGALLLADGVNDSQLDSVMSAEKHGKKRRNEELKKFEEKCRLKKIETRNELAIKLVQKLYLYTKSDMADDVAESFRQKMKYEAESLKMESFGLEILHLLGSIYKTKAKILLKSQTFLGGLGGLWWSMKDKGGVVRDTFKTVASALDAQSTMQEYTKMQADNEYHAIREAEAEYLKKHKADMDVLQQAQQAQQAQQDVDRLEEVIEKVKEQQASGSWIEHDVPSSPTTFHSEKKEIFPDKHNAEDLQEMEKYLIGKVLAAAWSGSKFEIQGTVRAVCDQILYEKDVSLEKRIARARGMKIIGSVFSETSRTEAEAEEARVFEELVAEASQKRRRKPAPGSTFTNTS